MLASKPSCISYTSYHLANHRGCNVLSLGGSPCDVMLNVTFNNEVVVDHAKGAWIQRPWDSRIIIRKVSGAIGNWAAHIRDSAMRVFYFAGNAWSDMMQIFISFRADKDERTEDKFQMLLSNGCNYTWIGYFEPSVALSYRAKDGTLKLQFQTYEPKTLSCNIISVSHIQIIFIYDHIIYVSATYFIDISYSKTPGEHFTLTARAWGGGGRITEETIRRLLEDLLTHAPRSLRFAIDDVALRD